MGLTRALRTLYGKEAGRWGSEVVVVMVGGKGGRGKGGKDEAVGKMEQGERTVEERGDGSGRGVESAPTNGFTDIAPNE